INKELAGEYIRPAASSKTAAQKQNPKKKPDADGLTAAHPRLRGSGADSMRSQESMSERFPTTKRKRTTKSKRLPQTQKKKTAQQQSPKKMPEIHFRK